MKRYFLITLAALAMLVSCAGNEDFSQYSTLQGKWYPEYQDMMVDKVIEFNGGNLNTYASVDKYPGVDGYLWNCGENNFKQVFTSRYSIMNGKLICSPDNYGDISLIDGKLYVNGEQYTRLEGFNSSYYSKIVIDGVLKTSDEDDTSLNLDFDGEPSSHELKYTVEKAIPGYPEVEISYDCDWIYNCFTVNGHIHFSVSEYTGGASSQTSRTGTISVSYKYAKTYRIIVTQRPLL